MLNTKNLLEIQKIFGWHNKKATKPNIQKVNVILIRSKNEIR